MEFLKNNKRFSFKIDGKNAWDFRYESKTTLSDNTLTSVYLFENGIKITNIAKKYDNYDTYEWVNYIENTSDKPTGLLSEVWDCDCKFPMLHQNPRKFSAYHPDLSSVAKLSFVTGSLCLRDDFKSNTFVIYPENTHKYASVGGRSSDGLAPFFNIHQSCEGYIFAIGWSGQWNCEIGRNEDDVFFRSKIEDTNFRLMPGEKFRTSSVAVMHYNGSETDGYNKWRRLTKEHFSLIGTPGRESYGPLCASIWGGMRSESVLERIEKIKKHNIPFEYIWMDAGWYGIDTAPTADEYAGGVDNWFDHTGDWRVSRKIHPKGLCDVSEALHSAGLKFLLWLEPERVIKTTPMALSHPEYFLTCNDKNDKNLLLDLGNPEAWNYCFDTISDLIERLNINCYRQDFNFSPLEYWRKNDKPDRCGITEIKHINGLYKLWDSLLEKFPHLIIDNCASGGRRIDIETLRRSIPMWRSDFQCAANYAMEGAQANNLNYNNWLPFSGTGTGRPFDEYRIRSAYSASLTFNHSFSENEAFLENDAQAEFLRKYTSEYLYLRPFFSEDFYPLTQYCDKKDVWCAMQFARPLKKDGIVEVFRREDSPYETATFTLGGINENTAYLFTDLDGGEFTISGKELCENGFKVTLTKRPVAKIYHYREI